MVNFEAVVFDMDGVLFDTESVSYRAWTQAGRELGIEGMEETFRACVGTNQATTQAIFKGKYGPAFDYDGFHSRTSALFHDILAREGIQLMPGVMDILTFLKAQGKPVALASSTALPGVMHHLNAAGIAGYFDAVMTGDRVTHGKPDPEIYIKACAALGKAPEGCIAIEDSPNGIRSAAAAGMRAVMVPDQIQPSNEIRALTYVIRDSLLDVLSWLREETAPEYWDAYDAQGIKIPGETLVRGERVPAGRYHGVACIAVRHVDGEYLFMRRDDRKAGAPGLWECSAGGSVLQGESFEEGARRELREETGICAGRMTQLDQAIDGDTIFAHYLCVTDAPKDSIRLQKGETTGFKWLKPQEIEAFLQTNACHPAWAEETRALMKREENR